MSPAAMTSMPLTVPLLGKLTTMPPGQCASVPGLSVQPQTPTVEAPTMSTSSSGPAFEVTRICLVPRTIFTAARTRFSSAVSGTMRSSASGCSFDILRILAPAFRISGVSTACISPSTVQSTTKPACCNAVTTGASRWIATLAPVERIGTICRLRGVGTMMWNGLAPIRNRASSAKWTWSARDCVSERIAAVSPDLTAQRSKISQNASIHFASMRSASMLSSTSNVASDFRKPAQQIGPQPLQQAVENEAQQRNRDQRHEHVDRLKGPGRRHQQMAETIGGGDHFSEKHHDAGDHEANAAAGQDRRHRGGEHHLEQDLAARGSCRHR